MHNLLFNLLIGIIGGIFSSIIVSRIFLIGQELEIQLDILRKNSYCLGSISAFFDVIEIILKNAYDTSVELKHNPEYSNSHDLIELKPTIDTLCKEILIKSIDEIDQFNDSLIITEKTLYKLHTDTVQITKEFKDIKDYKFDTIDSCKKQISDLNTRYSKCFKEKNSKFFSLVLKDKIMIVLYIVFLLICVLTLLTA